MKTKKSDKSLCLIIPFLMLMMSFSLMARVPAPLPTMPDTKSSLGVFRSGMAGVTNYSAWIERPVKFATAFADWNTTNIGMVTNSFNYLTGPNGICSGLPDREQLSVIISIPLVPKDLPKGRLGPGATIPNFLRGTAGEWDKQWKDIGKIIADRDLGTPWPDGRPKLIIRLGWEHTGSWFSWSSIGSEPEYKEYWKHVVDTVEAAAGKRLVWEWNCSGGASERAQTELSYPGDEYVDLVGLDFYDSGYDYVDQFEDTDRTPDVVDRVWQANFNGSGRGQAGGRAGYQWFGEFVRQHGKMLDVAEWGLRVIKSTDANGVVSYTGGGDNDLFIRHVFAWFSDLSSTGNLFAANYFEQGGRFEDPKSDWGKLSPGTESLITVPPGDITGSMFPKAAKEFLSIFGGPVSHSSSVPTISLTSPLDGARYYKPANVNLIANVTGSKILQVDFFNGLDLVGSVRSAPYQLSLTGMEAGNYTFTARVTDQYGQVVYSNPAYIDVVSKYYPATSITSPPDGATLTAPSDILITANATSKIGKIKTVKFLNGSTVIGTSTTPPYSMIWKGVPAGSYALKVRATDDGGLVKNSTVVNITVKAASGNSAPTVTLTSPSDGAVFTAPASITLKANASDANGISKVVFYKDDIAIATDTTSPHSFKWTNVLVGNYTFTAKAYDTKGSVKFSNPIHVTVKAPASNVAPTVQISTTSTVFTAPARIVVSAAASDSDGSIAKVEFYNGERLVATDTEAPYSTAISKLPIGSYWITAVATDNLGVQTLSNTIEVTVLNAPPELSLTSPTPDQVFTAPAQVTINAVASDANDSITKIEFYNGGKLLGTDLTAPYSYTMTGLTPGTYSIYANVTDNAGLTKSSETVIITVVPPVNPPAAPTGLTASVKSSDQIDLSWNDQSSDETGFKIEQKAGSGSYVQIATVGAGVVTYSDIGLNPGTDYSYRVRATNSGGDSAYSNVVSDSTPPLKPVITSPSTSTGTVNASWNYQIAASHSPTSFGASGLPSGMSVDSSTGLISGSTDTAGTYNVTVKATNAGGTGTAALTLTVKTASMAAPTNLNAVVSGSKVNLTWSDNSSDESSYKVYRKVGSTGSWLYYATLSPNTTTYTDTKTTSGKTYFYRVQTKRANDGGAPPSYSGWSNEVTAKILTAQLEAPDQLNALVSASSVTLTWVDHSTDETSFRVWRKDLSGDNIWRFNATLNPDQTTYVDTNVSAGESYSYHVKARKGESSSGAINSKWSNEVTVTLPADTLAAPGNLKATISATKVSLTWKDQSTSETSFKIWRKDVSGSGTWSYLATVGANQTSHADSTVKSGKTYQYRVKARRDDPSAET